MLSQSPTSYIWAVGDHIFFCSSLTHNSLHNQWNSNIWVPRFNICKTSLRWWLNIVQSSSFCRHPNPSLLENYEYVPSDSRGALFSTHLCSLLSCNAFIHHDWRHIFNVRAKTRTHVHLYVYVCKCTGLGGRGRVSGFKKSLFFVSCIMKFIKGRFIDNLDYSIWPHYKNHHIFFESQWQQMSLRNWKKVAT